MDIALMEFEYDPPRDCGPYAVELAWQHDQMAAARGMTSWYHPVRQTEVPGKPGSISEDEAYMGPLAWYLTTRTTNSIIDIQGDRNPGDPGFVRHTWLPVLDAARIFLGSFTGDPYLYATGHDPLGRKYHIWARNYANGLVMVRNVGDYGEGLEDAGAVTLNLPAGELRRAHADGTIDPPSSTISIKNGTGAIFLGKFTPPIPAADVPGVWWDGTPNFGTVPLTVHFQDHSTRNPTSWEWVLNDKTWDTSTKQNPTYTYTEPGLYTVRMRATNAVGTSEWLTMGLYVDAEPAARSRSPQ
jgi:hypothetical protein